MVDQIRSSYDRRVVMVRNSAKGHAICAKLQAMTNQTCAMMVDDALQSEKLAACLKTLGALSSFWGRAIDAHAHPTLRMVA